MNPLRKAPAALLATALLTPGLRAQAQPVDELTPPGVWGDYGTSVALDDDVAAVGATLDDGIAQSYEGAVHVWGHDGSDWLLKQKVIAPDGTPFSSFGQSIALDDDVLAVGAPFDPHQVDQLGSVYVYRRQAGGWRLETKLVYPGAGPHYAFGYRVALKGDVLAILGSDNENEPDEVMFFRDLGPSGGWSHEYTVFEHTTSFDVGENWVAVSTVFEEVLVFQHDGVAWKKSAALTGSSGDPGDGFGQDLAVDGDTIAVGSNRDDGTGAVYLFDFDSGTWNETARVLPQNPVPDGNFGTRVALWNNTLVVLDGAASGYEFREERGTWVETAIYDTPDGNPWPYSSVAVDGDRALLGYKLADRAVEFPASTPRLTVSPSLAKPGDTLIATTQTGAPLQPVFVSIININGIKYFAPLEFGVFGPNYAMTRIWRVPPGLKTMQVTFQSFALGVSGKLQASNPATVTFL